MKKLFLASLLMLAVLIPSFGWGRLGHAAINKIAEDHLTKTTKKAIDKYMNGESIVTFASYPDDYRARLDTTFRPEWNKARAYVHSYEVDSLLIPFRDIDDNGRSVANSLYFAAGFISELKNADSLDPDYRFTELAMLCHFIGDMHCPGHVRYQPKPNIASWPVTYLNRETTYHKVWDTELIYVFNPWSWSDFAALCDICTDAEIAEIVKGDVFAWGHDVAVKSLPVRSSVKKGDTLDADWALGQLGFARTMVRTAGYRLAHTLNMLFDPKYARKHRDR